MKNRAQVAAAILNNFATAIDATETAFNSAGSAEEENAKQLDSIQGKLQAVRAEFERLASDKGLNSTIKEILSLTAGTLKLINALGGLQTILAAVTTYLVITKWQSFINILLKLSTTINTVTNSFKLFYATSQEASGGLITMADASALLKVRLGLVITTITAVIAIINKVKDSIESWKASQEEERQKIIQSAKEVNNYSSSLIELYQNYKSLQDLTNKNIDKEEEYSTAIRNLAEALGYKTSALDDATIKQKEYLDILDATYKAELRQKRGELASATFASKTELESGRNVLSMSGPGDIPAYPLISSGLEEYLYLQKEVNEVQSAYNDEVDKGIVKQEELQKKYFNSYGYKQYSKDLDNIKEKAQDYLKQVVAEELINAQLQNTLPKTAQEQSNFARTIAESLDVSEDYTDLLSQIIEDILPNLNKEVKDNGDIVEYDEEALSKLYKKIAEANNAYSSLNSAVEEYNEQGFVSNKTLIEIAQNYPQYLKYLELENGQLTISKEGLEAKRKELVSNAKASISAQLATDLHTNSLAQEEAQAKGDFKALMDLKFARQDIWADYEATQKALKDITDNLFKETSTEKSTKDKWKEAFTSAYNDLKNRRDRDIIDNKTYYNELQALNNKYFKNREKYAEEYAKYELELYKKLQDIHKEEIESLEHDIAMLEYQEASPDLVIAKYRKIQEKLHEQAEKYRKMNRDGNQDLIDELSEQWWQYEKKIEDYQEKAQKKVQDRFKDIRDLAKDSIDEEIDALEEALDKQNALLDEQIDRYKEEKEALEDQKEIQEKLLAIEEARKKLAEAKNKKVRIYREGRGFVYESDFDAVSEAQSELDSLLEEWDLFQEKAKIEDIIAQLEAEKKANEERVNKQIDDLNKLKDAWDKSLDVGEEINDYKDYLEKLGEIEGNSYESRLEALQDFVDAYKSEMSAIDKDFVSPTDREESSESYDSGNRGTGKNSYNVNTDYQKLIEEAEAAGAPEDHLAYLERKRNNKIEGEGLNYEKTYKYHSPESEKKSSSISSSTKKKSSSSSSSGKSSIKSTISSVISGIGSAIKSLRGYASGTDNADGLLHFVGENGPELYVPPKGSGVISNPMTSNLMSWGEINPTKLVKELANNTQSTNIEVGNITLPNVKNGESFVEELKNFKGFVIQKQSVRK